MTEIDKKYLHWLHKMGLACNRSI